MSCDGSPPTANQWADFVTKLRFARAIQLSAAKAASLPEDLHADFAAIWLAFEAVLELVTDQPDITADNLEGPLVQLGFALGDVQDGRSPPILAPHRRKGTETTKGAAPTARLALRAWAAMAMDAPVATGRGRQDAARQVARTLEASGIPIDCRLARRRQRRSLDGAILLMSAGMPRHRPSVSGVPTSGIRSVTAQQQRNEPGSASASCARTKPFDTSDF